MTTKESVIEQPKAVIKALSQETEGNTSRNVFSSERSLRQPKFIPNLPINVEQRMNGLKLLRSIPDAVIPLAFFDPQYRGNLDKLKYGNEGKSRGRTRCELKQMSVDDIRSFIAEIERVLMPSGHLMLWIDKFILCSQLPTLLIHSEELHVVDMITWSKERMGMGYRSRRFSEHLIVIQRKPTKAKGVWKVHDIPDVWSEKIESSERNHPHTKPLALQKKLIEATTNKGDLVIDPAAGGYSVLKACSQTGRHFLGCDVRLSGNKDGGYIRLFG